jgi:outer membrane lipoprotein-sorting protein
MGKALNRKAAFLIILCISLPGLGFAQSATLESAEKFFSDLSANFGTIADYEATFVWTQNKTVSRGKISYKAPDFMRLDFSDPASQVIDFDGKQLTVYLPSESATLLQSYKSKTPSQLQSMPTGAGLSMMQRNFSVAYLATPTPVPLEDGSKELVVKLKLTPRTSSSFSSMILSVGQDSAKKYMIRRSEGYYANGDKVVLDLFNYRLNQGIPLSRFAYQSPATSINSTDWLFDSSTE